MLGSWHHNHSQLLLPDTQNETVYHVIQGPQTSPEYVVHDILENASLDLVKTISNMIFITKLSFKAQPVKCVLTGKWYSPDINSNLFIHLIWWVWFLWKQTKPNGLWATTQTYQCYIHFNWPINHENRKDLQLAHFVFFIFQHNQHV